MTRRILMMWTLPLLCCMALVSLSRRSEAAIDVVEVGANLAANQTSAVQNTITAIESVLQSGYMLIELTALGELVLNGASWGNDLARLEEILALSQALAWDLASVDTQIRGLFSVEAAPITAVGLAEHGAAVRMAVSQAYSYAMQAQTLMTSGVRTVSHMLALLEALGGIIGNLQGRQTVGQMHLKLSQLLAEQEIITATYQRAKTVDGLAGPVLQQGLRNINQRMMADHPR